MSDRSEADAAPSRTPGAPCPGICNRAWRRAETAYRSTLEAWAVARDAGVPVEVPEPHNLTAEKGEPVWCPGCRDTIRTGINRLPALAADVAIRHDGRLVAQTRAERHGTPGGSPSGSPAYDTFDEIAQWACTWEDAVRPLFGQPAANLASWTPTRGEAFVAACAFLAGWHAQILAHPDVGQPFGEEALGVVRRAERAAGLDGTVTRLRAPCRHCDLPGYQREDGSENVECRFCHDRMTMEYYEDTWSKLAASVLKDTA